MKSKILAGFLWLAAGVAAAAESSGTQFNLILEGTLPDVALLHVSIESDAKEFTQLTLPVVDGKLLQGIASPTGKSRLVRLSADDARGERLFEGEATLSGTEGFGQPVTLTLKSRLDGTPADVVLANRRVAIDFIAVGSEKEPYVRAVADVFDADGLRLPVKEGDLQWGFEDPWIRETLKPCPEGASGAALCAQFLPPREGADVSVDACYRGRICRIEFVPATPATWRTVAVGLRSHACALKKDGHAYCWGNDEFGQLGYVAPKLCDTQGGSGTDKSCSWIPQAVQCSSGTCLFTDISAGMDHTCAVSDLQEAWCWGNNYDGALGLGAFGDEKNPGVPIAQKVVGGYKFLSIRAGFGSTCGLTTTHEVLCWGHNRNGIIPQSAQRWTHTPTAVPITNVGPVVPVTALDHAYSHACAQGLGGELYCWGANQYDTLGPAIYPLAVGFAQTCANCPGMPLLMQDRIPDLKNRVVRLSTTGANGICAHLDNDHTSCWGWTAPAWTAVVPLKRLSRGYSHYCAINAVDTLSCAGTGALGDGFEDSPGDGLVRVGRPPYYFSEVDTGEDTTCGIGGDQVLYCWGRVDYGRLGIGVATSIVTKPAPVLMPQWLGPQVP